MQAFLSRVSSGRLLKTALNCGVAAALLAGTSSARGQAADSVEWTYYGGNKAFDRYSPLDAIDASNVKDLKILWSRPGIDKSLVDAYPDIAPSEYLRGTPIMVDGVLYAPDAIGLVEAFDPLTGATKWVQQPFEATLKEAAGVSSRGVAYWKAGDDARIVAIRGHHLYALDARTGAAIKSFGEHGRVELNRNTPEMDPYRGFNGPIVVGDVIVTSGGGGGHGSGDRGTYREAKPEDVRAYDVRTGALVWTFHVMPQPGNPDRETWGKGSAEFVGNMGAWAPMSADDKLGYVYIPLTAPTTSLYGGHRPGANLYSDTLVALDARTGRMVWGYQTIHHDLWEYDNASPPILGTIKVGGKAIDAVFQANKSGSLFVLDRSTGKPVWPIDEKPMPPSTVPGEVASPTQPVPSKPPAFEQQGITEDDLINFTPAIRKMAKDFAAQYTLAPLFTPPSNLSAGEKPVMMMPGPWGSGNWNTGAFDPETGTYYAVSMKLPEPYAVEKLAPPATAVYNESPEWRKKVTDSSSMYGPGPSGLPLLKPPYGSLTALDLNVGTLKWKVANGDGPRDHPLLKDLNLPQLGTIGRPVPLVTKTLVFLGESSDGILGRVGVPGASTFRAYSKTDGKIVASITLPAGTTGGPITYSVNGKQLIVVPSGSKEGGTAWVALGLKP